MCFVLSINMMISQCNEELLRVMCMLAQISTAVGEKARRRMMARG